MRLLEQAKVEYKHYSYANTDAISGVEVAEVLGQNVDKVFKTLVTVGKKRRALCFCCAGGRRTGSRKKQQMR